MQFQYPELHHRPYHGNDVPFMSGKKPRGFTISFEPELFEKLKQITEKERRSVARLIRLILLEYLSKKD